tara:strand:- start:1788 stop:2021 length:234 start_codon:yes stop_codon:yes gene_type:complete
MFDIGDLVQQRGSGVAIISEILRQQLHLGLIGVVIKVVPSTDHTYDGRPRDTLVIQWANGDIEELPEIYLEKIENNT